MADAYRAARQLERLFGYNGQDTLRQAQTTPYLVTGESRLIATIVYDPIAKTSRVERPTELSLEKRVSSR